MAQDLSLEALRDDLISRWKGAFDRLPEVHDPALQTGHIVYSRGPAFELSDFTPKKFKPGARLYPERANDRDFLFHLDAQGRPLLSQFQAYDGTRWQGFYRYTPTEAEYVEFCLDTESPSRYYRLEIDGKHVALEQRMIINCSASFPALKSLDKVSRINYILSDNSNFFILITGYKIHGDRVKSATRLYHNPTSTSALSYEYSDDNKLKKITEHFVEGSRTLFAAKSNVSMQSLCELLSEKIAVKTLAKLQQTTFDSPLLALELSYMYFKGHIPCLVPLTEADVDDIELLTLVVEIDDSRWLELDEEDFVPEISEFNQRLEESGSSTALTKMLREAARRVTERARQQLPVAPDFVAYAVDWEMDGDEIVKILKQCGAQPQTIKAWKKKGWLM